MQLVFEPFPENTPTGKTFKRGWETFVQEQKLPDVFWDPVQERWESYDRSKFTFVRLRLPRVELGTDYWTERNILHEVLNIGQATRALDAAAAWNPRDGYWYHFATTQRTPPPPPAMPPWLEKLIEDLASVDGNASLTPEERQQARSALIQAAYGTPH